MSWIKLDDQFIDHPKIVGLSDAAFRMWLGSISYCNRHRTDGHFGRSVLTTLCLVRYHSKCAQELVDAGLWDETDTGWVIHDYLDYQPSAEEIKAKSKQRSDAGRSGGKNRASKTEATRLDFASTSGEAKSKPDPVPTRSRPSPAKKAEEIAPVPLGSHPASSSDPWKLGDPITVPGDLSKLCELAGGPLGVGLTANARGTIKALLSHGPVLAAEYNAALEQLERRGKKINAGLVAAVIKSDREEETRALNGGAPPPKQPPPPGRGWGEWEGYKD